MLIHLFLFLSRINIWNDWIDFVVEKKSEEKMFGGYGGFNGNPFAGGIGELASNYVYD